MAHHDVGHYTDLIDRLFCRQSAPYGPYERVAGPPVIMVADTLVRAQIYRRGDPSEQYELILFDGIDGFAGDLWEYGLRNLMRLDALNHPALPKIATGSFDVSERIAFTLTEYPGEPLDINTAVEWAQENRTTALEQFSLLLDALSELNGARVLHRNLTAGALRWASADDGRSLKLCGFEMSTLLGDILRRGGRHAGQRGGMRLLYLTPPAGMTAARHYAYLPPEIHPYLFDERPDGRHDWATTDVFGLGVLGWELFCGPIPDRLPDEYAMVAAAEGPAIRPALARLHDRMRAHLTGRTDLPQPLTELLRKMLYGDPRSRDTAFQLGQDMVHNWETMYDAFDDHTTQQPYLIAFMPDRSEETIYTERNWISHSPRDPAGRDELKAFFERELAHAELVHSPSGAVGFVAGRDRSDDTLAAAQMVLVGERAVWFCTVLRQDSVGHRMMEVDQVLVIKFLANRERARDLVKRWPRRRLGAIDLVSFRPPALVEVADGRPSWSPLIESVRRGRQQHPDDIEFLRSLDFLREYQRTELNARCYPFRRLSDNESGTVILAVDTARDDQWRHHSPMLTAYAADPRRRQSFGDFFSQIDDRSSAILIDVFPGRGDRPTFSKTPIKVEFMAKKDDDVIEVRTGHSDRVPAVGWVRPQSDSGTHPQLLRQERALLAMENQGGLVRNLRRPASIDLSRGRRTADQGPKLEGNAPQIIDDMLALEPFYALQGPPGTGKTMVAVRALLRYLDAVPGARVLVSAQSNYALDNLAADLIKARPAHVLVLRWAADHADDEEDKTVAVAVQPYTLNNLTKTVVSDIQKTLRTHVDSDWSAQEKRLIEQWADTVRADQIELSDRIVAGANVVLATCSMSATLLGDIQGTGDHFDWVLVEEAAKAWPTEIIIPLVLGTRWTLIGDHRQLGAHRGNEVKQFLDSLGGPKIHKDMRPHYDARKNRLEALNLLGTLFESEHPDPLAPDGRPTQPPSPLGVLKKQFRMHQDIAEPVGRAFYQLGAGAYDDHGLPKTFLETGPTANRPHGVTSPDYLTGRALVWIDTDGIDDCTEHPRWSNPGEVRIITRIVEQMRPKPLPPDENGDNSLVVLTPYTAQVSELNKTSTLAKRVHTVHSFQGRQADRVIVSLVRSRRSAGSTVAANVGHVGQDEVVNVLLSRAQRLLVLVGNLRHFAEYGGPCWQTITAVVQRQDGVVRFDELALW